MSNLTCYQTIPYSRTISFPTSLSETPSISATRAEQRIGCYCWVQSLPQLQFSRMYFNENFFFSVVQNITKPSFFFLNSGLAKTHLTFLLSAIFSLFSSILLLIASSTYTILIKKCEAINYVLLTITDTNQKIPVGVVVDGGIAIYLMWASCACMILSVVPYFTTYALSPFSFKRGSLTAFGFVVVVHGVDEHKIILVERVSTNRRKHDLSQLRPGLLMIHIDQRPDDRCIYLSTNLKSNMLACLYMI